MNKRLTAVLTLTLTGLMQAPSFAGPYEDGTSALVRKDYSAALDLFRLANSQGSLEAKVQLGIMLKNGSGTDANAAEAIRLFREAAERNNVQGEVELASMLGRKGASPEDKTEAAMWTTKAAESGDAGSQMQLGSMFAAGSDGIPQDLIQAHKWYALSAMSYGRDVPPAPIMIGLTTQLRDGVAKKMSQDQLADAYKLARDWVPPYR